MQRCRRLNKRGKQQILNLQALETHEQKVSGYTLLSSEAKTASTPLQPLFHLRVNAADYHKKRKDLLKLARAPTPFRESHVCKEKHLLNVTTQYVWDRMPD